MAKNFEVLCATMNQTDFSKTTQMHIEGDVLFANQADRFDYREEGSESGTARMITTSERGVGKNRNLLLMFADAEICLMADDDVEYLPGYKDGILRAFEETKDADIIIFGLEASVSSAQRKPPVIREKKRLLRYSKNPYGGPRIAFRLDSVRKANLWFTLLFGGGCRYPSGEDSIFLTDARKKGLHVYIYPLVIGKTDYSRSSWFSGFDDRYYFGRGAYFRAFHRKVLPFWSIYCILRSIRSSRLTPIQAWKQIRNGAEAFDLGLSYEQWLGRSKS